MKYILFLVFFLIAFIYSPWFDPTKTLSSGDWPYLFKENIISFKFFEPPFLWLEPYYRLTAKLGVETLSFPWETVEKIFWFYPFLILSLISSWKFFNKILANFIPKDLRSLFTTIGCLIFMTNTYILMIVGGGQMGVGLAYALAPLVLYEFIGILQGKRKSVGLKQIAVASIVTALQLMLDPRVFLLTMFIVLLYAIFLVLFSRHPLLQLAQRVVSIVGISLLINLFWIIPNVSFYRNLYGDTLGKDVASFFSFSTFSNAVSLLHPNWPENIFGKVYFMRSEFLTLPILAYASLLFFNKAKSSYPYIFISFFSFLGLFGAFLAKGTNPPLGDVYLWLSNLPGATIFRDSTKFYLLIVLSYSTLIPLSLWLISQQLRRHIPNACYLIFATFLFFWLFSIRPALMGQLRGTFKAREVPREYLLFKNFLTSQPDFFTTFWIPRRQRFGFYSEVHPAIDSQDIIGLLSYDEVIKELYRKEIQTQIREEKAKYVVLPYDSEQELFLTDYKYDGKQREEIEKGLDSLTWLKKVKISDGEGKIAVYQLQD